MSSLSFHDTVVVVANAGSSVGSECANLFTQRGAQAVLNYPPSHGPQRHERCHTLSSSATRTENVLNRSEAVINTATSKFGHIDAIVYNGSSDLLDTSISDTESWKSAQEVELKGAFKLVKAAWPIFRKQKSGQIILTSNSPFVAFALLGFAHTLALEGAKYNIRVNVVSPQFASYTFGTRSASSAKSLAKHIASTTTTLAHKSNTSHTGSLFSVSDGGVAKFRWQRSPGNMLNPDENFTMDSLSHTWADVNDFSNFSYSNAPMDFSTLLPKAKALSPNAPHKLTRFDGRVAIVTGAASGLGRCYSLALAKLGASVIVSDLANPSAVVQEIEAAGGTARGIQASCEDSDTIVDTALAAFGRIDILINNAGFLRDKAFVNMEESTWDAVLRVHVNGTYQMTRAVWPYFVEQMSGSIVNTSSTSGIYGVFGQANYSTAKLAILGISEISAREGAKHGIRVNTIAPVASTGALAAAWANTNEKGLEINMKPEYNVPAVLLLSCDTLDGKPNTITGGLYEIGCGYHAATRLRPTAGCAFEKGKDVTPEGLLGTWSDSRWETGKSRLLSENAGILDRIKHHKTIDIGRVEYAFDDRNVILYNLSIGAKRSEQRLVYEGSPGFQALPTFAMMPFFSPTCIDHHEQIFRNFRNGIVVLGEHYLEIYHPIPVSGRLVSTGRLIEVVDKGSAAIAITGYTTVDANTGEKLCYNETSFYIGGVGGFGGKTGRSDRRSSSQVKITSRAADYVVDYKTSEEQAALYRLNGDREAIHIDPEASRKAGFSQPILHGQCFMGIAGREIFLKYGSYRSIGARFVGMVEPGYTMRTEMWKEASRVFFQVKVTETGKLCIAGGYVDLLAHEGRVVARM